VSCLARLQACLATFGLGCLVVVALMGVGSGDECTVNNNDSNIQNSDCSILCFYDWVVTAFKRWVVNVFVKQKENQIKNLKNCIYILILLLMIPAR
jgi:hypothetical protein